MIETPPQPARSNGIIPAEALDFYRRSMTLLAEAEVPFLVGGAYAFGRYTGIARDTKDFDIFVHPRDFRRALAAFTRAGFEVDRTFPHWLGKVFHGEDYVDLIFSSGNGVAQVDDTWFEHSVEAEVLGIPVRLIPAEEMIWSKSFIMERERFDGADVAHLLRCCAGTLDWQRLLVRFGDQNARVLLVHLLLFGYIYPDDHPEDAVRIPPAVLDELLARVREGGSQTSSDGGPVCRGTILSRSQYLPDVEDWGYRDGRLTPDGAMSADDIALWTAAAREEEKKSPHP
jgi:hypothetical protein